MKRSYSIILFCQDDAMRVLWAYGNEDPTDGIFDKHSFERRGSRTLYLLDEVTKYKMEDNVYTVDILNNNVSRGMCVWEGQVVVGVKLGMIYACGFTTAIHRGKQNHSTVSMIHLSPFIKGS